MPMPNNRLSRIRSIARTARSFTERNNEAVRIDVTKDAFRAALRVLIH